MFKCNRPNMFHSSVLSIFYVLPCLSRCSYVLDANGEARSFRPRDRDEMVKQVRLWDFKLFKL